MKTFALPPLLCIALLLFASPVLAKSKKHHDQASPTPEPERVAKPGDLPSVSLQPFVDTHLSQILAPLDQSPFDKPELIASMKATYADGQAAAPTILQPAYQAAQNMCDALTTAMAEREKSAAALKGSKATESSESENQPRGGRKATRGEKKNSDTFFADSMRNDWTQRADGLRKNIMALYLRERDLERQAIAAPAAASASPTISPADNAPAKP